MGLGERVSEPAVYMRVCACSTRPVTLGRTYSVLDGNTARIRSWLYRSSCGGLNLMVGLELGKRSGRCIGFSTMIVE